MKYHKSYQNAPFYFEKKLVQKQSLSYNDSTLLAKKSGAAHEKTSADFKKTGALIKKKMLKTKKTVQISKKLVHQTTIKRLYFLCLTVFYYTSIRLYNITIIYFS